MQLVRIGVLGAVLAAAGFSWAHRGSAFAAPSQPEDVTLTGTVGQLHGYAQMVKVSIVHTDERGVKQETPLLRVQDGAWEVLQLSIVERKVVTVSIEGDADDRYLNNVRLDVRAP